MKVRPASRFVSAVAVAVLVACPSLAATAEPVQPEASANAAQASLSAAEWTTIKRIIGDQLAALRSGDAALAFSFASTGIRDQFDDAPTFLLMVRQRYGVLLTARYTEFLEGGVIDGHTIQPLRLVMADDTVLVALYEMQRDEHDGWRIAGCVIAPSTVRST
jgi:hypothetical protein